MKCALCQQENPSQARFCLGCGGRLAAGCARCGAELAGGARFCSQCGHEVGARPTVDSRFPAPGAYTPKHLTEKILTSKVALEGERKQVTVLFCDIANSTAAAERLGAEAMHGLLSRFFELALAQVHRYEGTINQFLGDGFMALFGAPLAHEDHARRAVLAALGMQRALRERAAQPSHVELAVRIGLNTGFVVVGAIGDNLRMDYTAIGETTHLAARLQQLAQPGTIVVGETTARLVTGYVRLEALDPVSVKGVIAPVPIYRVEGLGRRRSPLDGIEERTLTSFVGRDRELTTLGNLLAQVEGGEGQVVGIVGAPGVGKSRLLLEFRRSLAGRAVTFLEGRCLSFGSTIPYLPIVDIIRNNCGIGETDTPDTLDKKLRLGLEEVGVDSDESAPYLLYLLGAREGTEKLGALSAEAVKTRTFETLRQMSLNGSQQRPIVFVVEDAHWIDRTSQEYLESLAESVAGASIMLLVTFRPGYRPAWTEKSYATQLSLQRLPPTDSLSVVRSVLAPERLTESTTRLILEKADGNPFFLEEMARAVAEQRGWHSGLIVPDTVHGVLMARIDQLPQEAKRLLQTASVLGREFSLGLLAALWEGGAFEQHLLDLKRMEFLYERTAGGQTLYVFKHALTQDVAYESLLESRRRALHAAAGRSLESLYATRLEEVYERLAHHYARAEEAEKAVEYLIRSGERAAQIYANEDAVRALEEALVHAERLPIDRRDRQLVDIVLRLAHSLYFLGRLRETLDLLLGHQERVQRLDDPLVTGPYYFWLGHTYSYLSQYDQATDSAQRALDEATRARDESTAGKAHYVFARLGFVFSQPVGGIEHGDRAIAVLERTDEWFWLGQSYWVLGVHHLLVGDFHEALAAMQKAEAIGGDHGDLRLQTYAGWSGGLALTFLDRHTEAREACERSLKDSRDLFNTIASLCYLGHALLEGGDPAAAIPSLEKAIELVRPTGYGMLLANLDAYLSEAFRSLGQVDRARGAAREGLEIGEAISSRSGAAYNRRCLGRIAADLQDLDGSEVELRAALDTFVRTDSRFEAARTRLDLAALAHRRGDRDRAAAEIAAARATFAGLRLPKYVERAERLAGELASPFLASDGA